MVRTNDSLLLSNDFSDQNEIAAQLKKGQDEDALFISQLMNKELHKMQEFDIKIDPEKLSRNAQYHGFGHVESALIQENDQFPFWLQN